jgi:hypothetical protein
MLVEGCFTEERTMSRLMSIVEGWLMLNVALAASSFTNTPRTFGTSCSAGRSVG